MTDEKYVFISDVREKKRTASGSFHKRTHAGKGGAVKLPSDYLSRKELNAMNGETKTYSINSPMKWAEFKTMPDDIKIMYIKAIRDKFHAANKKIAEMLGVHEVTFSYEITRLGLKTGGKGNGKFDGEGWIKWVNGIRDHDVEQELAEEPCHVEESQDVPCFVPEQKIEEVDKNITHALSPACGTMTFEGDATEVMKSVERILQDSLVRVTVTWEQVTV